MAAQSQVVAQEIVKKSTVYTATLRYARISPRKINYVAEIIRGLSVNRAIEVLMFNPKRASYFLYKLLKSAISNAVNKNGKVDVDRLYVKEVIVGAGPIMKRMGSAPRGRAVLIRRRFAHITISLVEAKEVEKERKVLSKQTVHEKKEDDKAVVDTQQQVQQPQEQKISEVRKEKTKKDVSAKTKEKEFEEKRKVESQKKVAKSVKKETKDSPKNKSSK